LRLTVTLLAGLVWPTVASASPRFHIRGRASCPAPAALARALADLLPAEPAVGADANAVDVEVQDLGTRYRVVVGGRTRELFDPARRCDERVRAAAVVIALAIELPSAADREPAAAPDPAATPAPPPAQPAALETAVAQSSDREPAPGLEAAPVRAPSAFAAAPVAAPLWHQVAIDLGAVIDVAPDATGGSLVSEGLALHLTVGRPGLGLLVGATVLAPTTIDLGVSHVRMMRVPLDVGLRLSGRRARAEGALDLGLRASVLALAGRGTEDTRLDLGGRAAVLARLWLGRWLAPFAAAELSFSPRSYQLVVDGVGTAGSTPRIWLGLRLGISARLD